MRPSHILLLPLIVTGALQCQNAPPIREEVPATFHSKVPIVLVDVIVTNNRGEPVASLKETDFQVFEDGKLQTVASFEEHKASLPTQTNLPPMPPGVFTNFPALVSADSVNVLLVDGLNTPVLDQVYVHSQILKYLKTIPPGARIAVFTLTTRLRMLQEFTTDSSALLAAVNSKSAATPYVSPVLQDQGEKQDLESAFGFVAGERVGPPPDNLTANSVDAAAVIQQVLAEEAVRLTETRARITLQSMQELARYLAAFPGRKNVMWVSGTFPIAFLPDSDMPDPFFSLADFRGEIRRTADLLTSARIAIYPISAQGLMGNQVYQANAMTIQERGYNQVTQDQVRDVRNSVDEGFSAHQTMEEMAKDTGGQAFYETNGISDAFTRVTNDSASFYTLSYTPANRKMDGKYRHISVKLAAGKEKLSYRRGYFAATEEDDAKGQGTDPLLPLVAFGMPDVSQIVYKIRVVPAKMQGGADKKNSSAVEVKGPGTTYSVDFAISLGDLKLDLMPDGTRHGSIELKLVAYDDSGKVLNMVGGNSALSLRPDMYENMRRVGLQLHQQIDVPGNAEVRLYSGICDLDSGRIGTLGVRVRGATAAQATK